MNQAYASINKDETRILDQLPFEERWLYICSNGSPISEREKSPKFGGAC